MQLLNHPEIVIDQKIAEVFILSGDLARAECRLSFIMLVALQLQSGATMVRHRNQSNY
jgi:hypothetical protein